MTFLHPFDDIAVIAGQGTIGLELLEQCPQLEAVVVPVGGGGLDRRRGLRHQGAAPRRQNHRRADRAPALDGRGREAARTRHRSQPPPPSPTASPCAAPATSPVRWSRNMSTRSSPSKKKRSPAPSSRCSNAKRRSPKAPAPRPSPPCCSTRPRCNGQHTAVHRRRRQHRRLAAQPHHRARPGQGRPPASASASTCRTAPARSPNFPRSSPRQRANIVELLFDRAYYGVSLGDTAIDVTLETRGAAPPRRTARRHQQRRLHPRTHPLNVERNKAQSAPPVSLRSAFG